MDILGEKYKRGSVLATKKALKANFQMFEWQLVIRCSIMITST